MEIIFFLLPLSFVMGFVNSIAGGGGVFGVPAMIALGIPPVNALALNRVSDLGNIAGSLKNYLSVGGFDKKLALIAIPPILIGALMGANFVVGLEADVLHKTILGAVLIGVVFLVFPFKPKKSDANPQITIGIIALIALGFWDGAFAMAGGTFGVLIFVMLFNKSYLGAKSIMTFSAIPETIISASILLTYSNVSFNNAFLMFFSGALGAYLGSGYAIKKGSVFIRYAMAAMACVMVLKIVIFDIIV